MRLKTLRKERPAFENEGAVVSGSRMDLSNSEYKPNKYRTNNSFALPTSLSNELCSPNMSPSNQTPDLSTNYSHIIPTTRRTYVFPTPSQPTRASSYQAIEAAYLEHGIRIHLNPSAAAAVATQQSNSSTENLNPKKTTNGIQRHKAFVNRVPSRASSAFDFPPSIHDTNQDSRPFSALQQTSTEDFHQTNSNKTLQTPTNQTSNALQLINPFCSSTIVASEQADHIPYSNQLAITNGTTSTETLVNNDPDLAYMSSLLQTTSGDCFRDTIRRRAGLRATFAVHRHPQYSTAPNSKLSEKSSVTHSSPMDRRNSILRTSTIAVVPTSTTPSSKKVEKDILKHASRIRTNQIRDPLVRQPFTLRSQPVESIPSISHSPIRFIPPTTTATTTIMTRRSKTVKPSKTISLEPLELLLAPSSHSRPSPPARSTSLTIDTRPMTIHHEPSPKHRPRSSRKRSKSPKICFAENNNVPTTNNLPSNEPINSLYLTDDSLPLMKTSPLDLLPKHQIHPSNSSDSGCYDQSSSADTRSITSLSINQASSSIPSARLTSANTRRSNINKKVSFEDQYSTIVITTATYV